MQNAVSSEATLTNDLPLVVDLDGTLVRTDTLLEGLCALATGRNIFRVFWPHFLRGRAAFKRAVAEHAGLDPKLLPYNEGLLAYLRSQKARGRHLVLATAADIGMAQRIADHLGIFDTVIASDGAHNLKGDAKAHALTDRFGVKGFVYAGDSRADLAVWRVAHSAILVNASPSVTARAKALLPLESEFYDPGSYLVAWLRALRPHQWVKNLLIFVPIFTAHAIDQPSAWIGGIIMLAAFCATASGIYIVNDLCDLAADRAHPRKRLRAFASGSVSLSLGIATAVLLLVAGFAVAGTIGALPIIATYAIATVLYSMKLKQLPLVDVFSLAGFYVIRIFSGGVATGHALSLWLFGASSFLFLSLALLKRVEELMAQSQNSSPTASRRGYLVGDAAILQTFGCASAFAACLVLAVFVQNEATAERYASPSLLWGIVPLMLFWLCRLWLSTARGYMHEDPIVYAARDWVSWIIGGLLIAILALAKSKFHMIPAIWY